MTASRQAEFEAVLLRHGAALSRLRGPRGVVRCVLPGHEDRAASLSVDLSDAVFHCFGCGRGGGLKTLRELLGEGPPAPGYRRTHAETEFQRARRDDMERERRVAARREEWLPLWHVSDHIRRCARLTREARQRATRLGSDDPRTWPLLERAAAVAREGLSVEAELDSILAEGRIA